MDNEQCSPSPEQVDNATCTEALLTAVSSSLHIAAMNMGYQKSYTQHRSISEVMFLLIMFTLTDMFLARLLSSRKLGM